MNLFLTRLLPAPKIENITLSETEEGLGGQPIILPDLEACLWCTFWSFLGGKKTTEIDCGSPGVSNQSALMLGLENSYIRGEAVFMWILTLWDQICYTQWP